MALVSKKAILDTIRCSVQLQSKRFRGKINVQKPRPPHFLKAKYLELAKPIYINKNRNKSIIELCNKNERRRKEEEPINPLQQIIARELYNLFEKSRLIAFYQANPMKADEQFKAKVLFKKHNMEVKICGTKTMEMAIKGTPYEATLEVFIPQTITVFSPEPDIKSLLTVTKKFPKLILLAAVFEGKFISKDEIMHYSLIPDLQTAQANFVGTLNSIGGNVVNQLTTHQTNLVNLLQERIKQLEEDKK